MLKINNNYINDLLYCGLCFGYDDYANYVQIMSVQFQCSTLSQTVQHQTVDSYGRMRLTLSYDTSSNISWICVGFSTGVETGWEELRESTSMASKHFPKKKSSWDKERMQCIFL